MSEKLLIFDTTLRDGEQSPGCSMSINEKTEMAKQLEKLGVDIIEAGFAAASEGDFNGIQKVSSIIKNSIVCSLSRATKNDIELSYSALKNAVSPRIHTFIATSDIHLNHKLNISREEALEQAISSVKFAKSLLDDVEFSAEDASRTDIDFLCKVINEVIKAGAKTINIPDTVGYSTPLEMSQIITQIKNTVPNIDKAILSVHCHNDLGLGVANSLAAISSGVKQVECTINGIGERAGNAALEEIVMNIHTKKSIYNLESNINTKEIYKTSQMLQMITGVKVQPNKAIVGENAFLHEAGIHQHGVLNNRLTYEIISPDIIGLNQSSMILGKHSGRHAFITKLKEMNYVDLSDEKINELFFEFKALADKKKNVSQKDIEALIFHKNLKPQEFYKLNRYVITVGNSITNSAILRLEHINGNSIEEVALGDGPIDAAFKAIEKIVKLKSSLDDFSINSITEGKDAQGQVRVRLKIDNKKYTGIGISTDIVEASIKAYICAINVYLTKRA